MALALSIIALLATFYQLYLQRVHNEKSVKPLIQINLTDHNGLVYIHIQNNGLGPLIVERLKFTKNDHTSYDITDSVSLDPKSYQHVAINESVKKIVPQEAYLEVFSRQFDQQNQLSELENVRRELSGIVLTVEGKDMYDNKVSIERNLSWFARHLKP